MKDKVIKEFRRLFWAARAEHLKQRPSATGDTPAHKEAMDYALEPRLEWGQLLLLASLFENQGKTEDALKLLDSLEKEIPATEKGYLWFLRGSVLRTAGRVDDAIKAYNKVIEDHNFDKPGDAWNNLGNAQYEKGDYDEAIKAYQKALSKSDKPGVVWYNMGNTQYEKGEYNAAISAYHKALEDSNYDTPSGAWNGLGVALLRKGEYDEAINEYHKALEDPKYDTPGIAWNSLGGALHEKGEHDKAIEAFRKALEDPNYDTPGIAWYNLGLVSREKGENEEAIIAYRKALEDPKFDKERGLASRARSFLRLLESDLPKESLSADDRALLGSKPSIREKPTPEHRILEKMDLAGQSLYDRYLEKPASGRDNVISVLRGWSSAVPLLEGSERLCRGGGYFLKWKGKGIVIDPGWDFLQNFHDAKYRGTEVHLVLVSHHHPDHHSDLKSIDHLKYELFTRLGKSTRKPYLVMLDKDTDKFEEFPVKEAEHRLKTILFDAGRRERDREIKDLDDLPFSLDYFSATHAKEVPNAIGFRLHLANDDGTALTIGYTGDTEFFDDLSNYLKKCDLLIAHMSQPDRKELEDYPNHFKERHLGYRGLVELVKKCKPKATLASEFWAGLGDLRIVLIQGIRERTGNQAILPASIGMHIHLPDLEVECTQCAGPVPFEKVRVAPPANRFGNLSYLCESCMLGG